MKQYNVAIIGATGMVGQRFSLLLAEHPWFRVARFGGFPLFRGEKI